MVRTNKIRQNSSMIMSAWIVAPVAVSLGLYLVRRFRSARRHAQQLENYQTAIQLLDRMILRDPTNAMAFWQKGEVYEDMGLIDRALQYYRVAHEMCPRAYAYYDFTTAYQRLKGSLKIKPAIRIPSFN